MTNFIIKTENGYVKTDIGVIADMDKVTHVPKKGAGRWDNEADAQQVADFAKRIRPQFSYIVEPEC